VTETEIAEIAEMPGIASIEPDTVVTIQTDGRPPVIHRQLFGQGQQEVPYGVDRVNGGRRYLGDNVAFVADTGIDRFHLDLNVDVDRGRSFVTSGRGFLDDSSSDTNGHGTQ
jgi:subtilisin family serine protease